jgi:hypothetical protein
MCVAAHRRYSAGMSTPAAARQFGAAAVIAVLNPSGWNLADDAALVISELVSSAVKAGAASLDVLINLHRDRVEITVTDDRTSDPAETDTAPIPAKDPSRQILTALSASRGAALADDGRTAAWAHLPCDPRSTTHINCVQQLRPPTPP